MPATLTYRPLTPQNPAEFLRPYPSISAGYAATHPVQPLKGLPGTRATDVSYRALAPVGAGFCYRICTGTSESRPTANYSLLTANSLTFTFSAKERDPETGLSYFGSRYYSSDLSVWLSVDPMAAKYASLSPYVYCADNPVKLVDPNGEEVEKPDDPPKKNNSSNQQSSYSMVSYYTQQYKKANDVTTKVNYGLKLVGAKLNFDEQKIVDAAAPYLQGLVLVNPLVGIPNDIKTVFSGYDFYGNQSGLFDRFAAGFDALSFRAAKTMKFFGVTLSKGFEKTLNFFNFTTTSYSVGSTINIQKSQSKKGVGNAQRQ